MLGFWWKVLGCLVLAGCWRELLECWWVCQVSGGSAGVLMVVLMVVLAVCWGVGSGVRVLVGLLGASRGLAGGLAGVLRCQWGC